MNVWELADWLINFHSRGGTVTLTCNAMGILAQKGDERHYFSIMAYEDVDVAHLLDILFPYFFL